MQYRAKRFRNHDNSSCVVKYRIGLKCRLTTSPDKYEMNNCIHPNSNSNNNDYDNVYGAVIMTKVIARVHPVHLMNV